VTTGTPPAWLETLASAARRDYPASPPNSAFPAGPPDAGGLDALYRHRVPADVRGRESAVLVLFGESRVGAAIGGPDRGSDRRDSDVLLTERAHTMRSHPGQPAFPGGTLEPGDRGPVDAALREAAEETGLDPGGVDVLTTFPPLWLPPGGYIVTPVLGWWREPSEVSAVDTTEVASVHRVPLTELVDPSNRLRVRHPSGYVGPAFRVSGLLVWGFTAGIIAALLDTAGLALPWDRTRVEPLPPTYGAHDR
jgi:8-oxo-dGTP pyrophosphatase MutT (NUDIX family)